MASRSDPPASGASIGFCMSLAVYRMRLQKNVSQCLPNLHNKPLAGFVYHWCRFAKMRRNLRLLMDRSMDPLRENLLAYSQRLLFSDGNQPR